MLTLKGVGGPSKLFFSLIFLLNMSFVLLIPNKIKEFQKPFLLHYQASMAEDIHLTSIS